MKSSNVLLTLWILLVAGLAMVAVWYLRTADSPTVSHEPVVEAPPPKPPVAPPKPPRDKTPRTPQPRVEPKILGSVSDGSGKPVAGAVVQLHPPAKSSAPSAAGRSAEALRIAHIVTVNGEDWDSLRPLSVWSEDPPTDPRRTSTAPLLSAETGADGKFTLNVAPSLGRGPFLLIVRVETVGSAFVQNAATGQTYDLTLSSGGVVTGSVIAEDDGKAVADAKIVFDSGEKEYTTASDAAGAFRVESMPPGRYIVRAGAKGRTPILDQPVTVVRGEPLKLVLPRGITLRVRTVLTDGTPDTTQPVPNAEIVVLEETTLVYVTGKSNDYGLAEFTGLPAGQWVMNARAEKFISQGDTLVTLEVNKPIAEEEITFETAVLTPIQVVDENGAPVAGVEFYTSDGDSGYDVSRSQRIPGATDSDGRFSYPFEFDGPRCMVFGFRKDLGLVQCYPDDYSAGEAIRLVMRRGVRIFGKVTDEGGAPVADALVRLTIDPGENGLQTLTDAATVQVRTNAKGLYEFPYVPDGFEVMVEAETEDTWSDDMPTVEPVPGQREFEVNLQLEATPVIRGTEGPLSPAAPGTGEKK